uniref:Aminotransferase-like plant mobile domain-containing protein n=1 Tax=Fagus sylvatica TaxID=28930 RepID=A0A2N9F1L0_FAGSY
MIARSRVTSCYILSAAFQYFGVADVLLGTFSQLPFCCERQVSSLETLLDHEENVLFRPYGDDHPGFTCASIFRKFYQPSPLIRDLKVDDYRSLSYLSTVNPGFLPTLSATGVSFIPYCPQRVQRQFGLDQGIPVGPQETTTCVADLTAFLKSRAFARWGGETTRVLIPGGHRLGFNTPSMGAYWQRFTQSMVEFVIAGRSDKTPMSVHQSLDSLNGMESEEVGLPIPYICQRAGGASVNVVEDRLIMLSKRGKGGKREAPVDLAIEKTSKKPTPSVPSPKKAPSKKTKAGKKRQRLGRKVSPPFQYHPAVKESTTALMEEPTESTVAPSKKTKAGKKGKSPTLMPSAAKESTTAPVEEPTESTVAPSKSQESPSPSKKKKFVAPLFPLGAAGRTRSKSGPKVTHASGRSGGGVVDVEVISPLFSLTSDVADDDVIASPLRKDAPQTAAVDQDEELRKSVADSSEVGAESTGEDHSSSRMTPSLIVPQIPPMEEDLAIVPHASHGRDDDSAVDADADPISFSVPQTGSDQRRDLLFLVLLLALELFRLAALSYQLVVLLARPLQLLVVPLYLGKPMYKGLVESESVVDLGVSTADHNAPIEDAGASAADTLAGSDHLENIGMDDTVHVSEDVGEVGITGEVTAVSPPPRPTIEAGSSVGVGSLSSEVADFLKEFDAKAPNPHPEQYFWSFNGPLVPFGDFWVPNDCSPYLSRLSAGHSDFTKGFKLSIGLGGPMLSLLGSVLAAMSESSLEDVTTTQILAWRSVIQDLMDVGFDLGFMIERLRQTAQCLFGKRLADEIKALQHQIAVLQDSLAELTAYQDEMMSTGRMVPRPERGGSFLDSLLD